MNRLYTSAAVCGFLLATITIAQQRAAEPSVEPPATAVDPAPVQVSPRDGLWALVTDIAQPPAITALTEDQFAESAAAMRVLSVVVAVASDPTHPVAAAGGDPAAGQIAAAGVRPDREGMRTVLGAAASGGLCIAAQVTPQSVVVYAPPATVAEVVSWLDGAASAPGAPAAPPVALVETLLDGLRTSAGFDLRTCGSVPLGVQTTEALMTLG